MYHFADHGGVARLPGPSWGLTLLEPVRLPVELTWSLAIDRLAPDSDLGAGRPVLVLPGFSADDLMTSRLRAHLTKHGFAVHGWGLGRNHGLTDQLVDGLLERFDEVADHDGAPVSVVGWSFGGLLARWLAHQRSDRVRQVVCLGSPWRAEGELTRTTPLFERAARRHGLSPRARDIVTELREPLPVPLTVLWSRTDGIVNGRGCVADGPSTENLEVPSSHVGLPSNPLSLAVLTDRLAQDDPRNPEPFSWRTALRALAPHPARALRRTRAEAAR
jgi:pimeloyl-ACP methyl ester carboxylesterase